MEGHSSFAVLLKQKTKDSQPEDDHASLPPLHRACARGDVTSLTELIHDDPALLEAYSPDGLTPLGQAVLGQQLEAVQALIRLQANVDAQDSVGRSCLSIAAYQGWHQGVMCLLRAAARQSICDKSGRYPLHAATYHSDMSTLSLLLNSLTSKEVNLTDHEMMTAVHWAAFHDRPEHLMLLVQKGGDILQRDVDGKLALHWAAQNNSFQCAHRLTSLPGGLATVNDVDFSGKTATHYAAAAGAANIITVLSRCEGCDVEAQDPDQRTPLHWASAMGHCKAVEALLELGVNPQPVDADGGTPLDYATQAGSKECIKLLEEAIGKDEIKTKQKYLERPISKPSAPGPVDMDRGPGYALPDIEIQPPTTEVTKSTSNRTVRTAVPRMYSASTDTDMLDMKDLSLTRDAVDDAHAVAEDAFTTSAVKNHNQELVLSAEALSIAIKQDEAGLSRGGAEPSAIESLIGSSFVAGSQVASPRGVPLLDSLTEESESSAGFQTQVKRRVKDGSGGAAGGGNRNNSSVNTPELQVRDKDWNALKRICRFVFGRWFT